MDELTQIFAIPAVERLHASRTKQIIRLLGSDQDTTVTRYSQADSGLRYAVAHHLLEGAEIAAHAADQESFAWYRHAADHAIRHLYTATEVGQRIIVAPDLAQLTQSPISETPYFLLCQATVPADDHSRQLTTAAMATAVDAHFGTLLVGHAAIVCLLRCKKLGATLDSWTISRLPGTIFTDHTGEAAILARDLIHEAGHNWLNDALAALEIKLDPEKSFFSPWKHTNRPAFGFLHACWAFPLTMIFAASVLDRLTERVREYLSVYLRQQVEALASTAGDHARALALIPDTDLRDRLQTVYRAALALRA